MYYIQFRLQKTSKQDLAKNALFFYLWLKFKRYLSTQQNHPQYLGEQEFQIFRPLKPIQAKFQRKQTNIAWAISVRDQTDFAFQKNPVSIFHQSSSPFFSAIKCRKKSLLSYSIFIMIFVKIFGVFLQKFIVAFSVSRVYICYLLAPTTSSANAVLTTVILYKQRLKKKIYLCDWF